MRLEQIVVGHVERLERDWRRAIPLQPQPVEATQKLHAGLLPRDPEKPRL